MTLTRVKTAGRGRKEGCKKYQEVEERTGDVLTD